MAEFYKINPVVMVGIPTLMDRPLSWEWEDYYLQLSFPLGTSVGRIRRKGKLVADARNEIVEQTLMNDADYLMFISDDVLCPPRTFEMLWRHRKHMVTGVYWTKYQPTHPYLWDNVMKGPYLDWTFGEFIGEGLDLWGGCDCLLVHTEVFKKMKPPWFSHDWAYRDDEHPPLSAPTEDLYFYTKARELGYKLYCDTAVQCDHQDRATGIRYGLTDDMPQFKARDKWNGIKGRKFIADIGCGKSTPFFGEDVIIHRIDQNPEFNPDICCDIRKIPVEKEKYDIVHARHVLEHFPMAEAHVVVQEWIRILKIDGELIIEVPNIYHACKEILKTEENHGYDAKYAYWQLYGLNGTYEEHEYHKVGYGKQGLERVLKRAGHLKDIQIEYSGTNDINITAKAIKSESSNPYSILPKWKKNGKVKKKAKETA